MQRNASTKKWHKYVLIYKGEQMKIYIAGPITGTDDYEERFNKAEARLKEAGFEPVNPIGPGLLEGAYYKYYIDRGLRLLMDCDAIIVMDNFETSKGTLLEVQYCKTCGIPVYEFNCYGCRYFGRDYENNDISCKNRNTAYYLDVPPGKPCNHWKAKE